MAETFVDASVFMGMHSRDEAVRVACKDFFVSRLSSPVVISLEQVGVCDDLVWRFDRTLQDAYYPFMDNLHTDMPIERRAYRQEDLVLALECRDLSGLPLPERLVACMAMNAGATLYSVNPRLRERSSLPVRAPASIVERRFPGRLEDLYRQSLQLRVPAEWR